MEPGKLILLVEDDAELRSTMRAGLAAAGLRVVEAENAEVGLQQFRLRKPDLVVLDVVLPDGDGFEVCRGIRESQGSPATPVIMLTSRAGFEDKAAGFTAGADQYLVKPVVTGELVLWVQALLRRLALDRDEGDVLQADELLIELDSHRVRWRDLAVTNLTVKEFDLLCLLVKKRPKVLDRKQILDALWRTITVDKVVDVHIGNLRRKLPPEVADRIQSIPGRGYRFLD